MGLLLVARGQITLAVQPLPILKARSRDLLKRVQLIHQHPDTALNPRPKVRAILSKPFEVFLGLRGAALEERIQLVLQQVELPAAMAERYPGAVSSGQKQRVCIARALAAEPELMVCDEITACWPNSTGAPSEPNWNRSSNGPMRTWRKQLDREKLRKEWLRSGALSPVRSAANKKSGGRRVPSASAKFCIG